MAAVIAAEGRWGRQHLLRLYTVAMGGAGVLVTALSAGQVVDAATRHPAMWLMTALAVLAGALAFIDTPAPGRSPLIVCPTICFTFAILLCWGLGPAIVAQAVAVLMVRWKLRAPMSEGVKAWGQYTLAFAAAAGVLWLGQPDPFERAGPTNIVTDAVAVVGAVAAWLVVYAVLEFGHSVLRGASAHPRGLGRAIGNQLLFKASLLLLSPVLAVAAHINVGFVPLIFLPLFAVQRMARLSAERDRAARMDPLTGLANRTGLRAGFCDLMAARDRVAPDGVPAPRALSLLMLDLDRFKHVNDSLGHDVGDRLLVGVAHRIASVQPRDAIVARLGGDEFAILLATHTPEEAERVACSVVHALVEPVRLDRLQIDVTASLGIASYSDGEDFATLLRHADVAMYEAKQRGDAVATYAARADQNSPERLKLLTDFRDALSSPRADQVTMHYQPQVSLATGEVEGVEALLRWHHPTHGLVSTRELLSVAEHSSVMRQLTMRVIDDVTAQAAGWPAAGLDIRASLNVSVRDLYSDDLATHLARRLDERGVPPERIQVEITESSLLADPSRVQATVNRIAGLGVAVSLDDFGTGYSSLQHLRRLPISEIKIDRSFVSGMAGNRDDAAIVRSIVEMARTLGIRTVAEGVENEYTRRLLAETGCTLIQGWIAARPMPGGELVRWMAAGELVRPAVGQLPQT
ncbi:EAL domain-containing protein [Phytohabitans sp. ZYX-F-186]|uniref:EAL domain-containing protein n=1 Tax=Phytohabitans maris TaxID=3071409 RepID=A0ABU0Z7S3_9ACTN|nr:EAL domain-containing protein [Phytohabitans sp. ZYX-F-186]MDQ7903104.1 EAL domain-containing protein [Phytohabitans sp. ZYX-F-186]